MPHTFAADEMADLLGEIFGVIPGALERLSHKQDVKALGTGRIVVVLQMPEEHEVAEAIQFSIGAQHAHSATEITQLHRVVYIGQHFLESRCHHREIANVLQLDSSAHSSSSIAAVQEQIADALQSDDELHASEKFVRTLLADFCYDAGDTLINFTVESVKFLFALTYTVQQRGHPGGDSLSDNSCCFTRQLTRFERALLQVCCHLLGGRRFRLSIHNFACREY